MIERSVELRSRHVQVGEQVDLLVQVGEALGRVGELSLHLA